MPLQPNNLRAYLARKRPSLIAALLLLLTIAVIGAQQTLAGGHFTVTTGQQPRPYDPDRPVLGNISESDYLRLRDEYVATIRGWNTGSPSSRSDAIRQMQTQQARQAGGKSSPNIPLASWASLGPAPSPNGQTSPVNPVTGRVTAIVTDPTNPDIIYLGTAQGGVWRSTIGGYDWTPIFDNAQSLAIGALAIAPSNHHILYVGTGEANFSLDSYAGVGLYRIDNADTTTGLASDLKGPINPTYSFNQAGTGSHQSVPVFNGLSISRILVKPDDPNTIFVATTSGGAGVSGSPAFGGAIPPRGIAGLYRSTNAAASNPASITFTKLTVTTVGSVDTPGTGNRAISDIVLDPANPNSLTAWVYDYPSVGDAGIYHSSNALAPSPAFSQVMAASASSIPSYPVRGTFAVTRAGGVTRVFAATSENATGTTCSVGGDGVLRESIDGGQTWPYRLATVGGFAGGQGWYDLAIAVDPSTPSRIYLGGSAPGTCSHIFERSTDGATFSNSDARLHADTHVIYVDPTNSAIVYTGNDGGVWKSTDYGATWTDLNNDPLSITQFESLAVHPTDSTFTIGGSQDNGTHCYSPGGPWTRCDGGDGGYSLIDQSATSTDYGALYHTYYEQTGYVVGYASVASPADANDAGWEFRGCLGGVTHNGINCDDAVLFYAPMALGPGTPNTVYFGTDTLYRSADNGENNLAVSQFPLVSCVGYARCPAISAIGVSPHNDNVRIVGSSNGHVWATTTGSHTLTDISTGSPLPANYYVARAVIDPSNSNVAYVTYAAYLNGQPHVWKNTNLAGGASHWTPISNGLPDVPVNAFVVDPAYPTHLYAGTDIGVYASADGGASWEPFGTGLPTVAVFDMAIQPTARVLKVATHGRGMWQISLTGALGGCPITYYDVPFGSPYYDFVRCLACRNILSGYADDARCPETGAPCFRPSDSITRGQAAKIIANAAGYTDSIDPSAQSFADVPASDPFWLYIERVHQHGAISGYVCSGQNGEPDTGACYRPSANLSRGQLAKIATSVAAFTDTPTGQSFNDVPPGSPFYTYIERAHTHNIISGYGCGADGEPCPGSYFRPSLNVTRGQAAKIVSNTFFPGCSTP